MVKALSVAPPPSLLLVNPALHLTNWEGLSQKLVIGLLSRCEVDDRLASAPANR